MEKPDICIQAGEISSKFERNTTELKKKFILKNINTINTIMENAHGYSGSFGTGYPFYTLDSNLEGQLPIIKEQIRYNEELINAAKNSKYSKWACTDCLKHKGHLMPDLKQICKPCPEVEDELKPRKVINRLPDIDMWMICQDPYIEVAKTELVDLFDKFNMHTSDVNPIQSIQDITEIVNDLENDKMPVKKLPLDVHIIEYSKFGNLIDEIPFTLNRASENQNKPYLPIHPISLRKTWQYDDVAYNFVLDFLFSLTSFNFDSDLEERLNFSRSVISNSFTNSQLSDILFSVAPDSVERRLETKQLQKTYERRVDLWRK